MTAHAASGVVVEGGRTSRWRAGRRWV